MDWNKLIDTILACAQRVFTIAAAVVLIIAAVTAVYLAGVGAWWLVRQANEFLGIHWS